MTLEKAIKTRMVEIDLRKPELAAALCMSTRSLYRRLENPDLFTIGELKRAAKKLHVPLARLMEGEIA